MRLEVRCYPNGGDIFGSSLPMSGICGIFVGLILNRYGKSRFGCTLQSEFNSVTQKLSKRSFFITMND